MAEETIFDILAEMRGITPDEWANLTPRLVHDFADRIEAAVQRFVADDCAKCAHYNAATISLKDALALANTIANHGINANDLGDKASATIYALCHEVRTVRGEDANIKQEVQKLRRELRDLRRAPGNAAAMRAALKAIRFMLRRAVDEGGFCAEEFSNFAQQADAALAAPARNCDRFQSEEEAYSVFMSQFPRFNGERHYQYCKWLYAPAEGGDHA